MNGFLAHAARETPKPAAAAALVALALLSLPPLSRAEAAAGDARTIAVTGNGEVHAAPDLARVTIGATARAPTVEAARAQVNPAIERLLAITHKLGIADAQVRSTRITVNPEYDWSSPKHQRQLTGYAVNRQLSIELKDLDKLGPLIEQSLSAGADVVQDPVLDSSHRADLERQALAAAISDAYQNALVLAKGADASVGAARNLSSSTVQYARPMPVMRMAAAATASAEAPQTFQSGELDFQASVSAVYDLLPNKRP
jgi:uncharacterized protein YggE